MPGQRAGAIPDALDARLRHEAERRNVTIADISREALEAYLGVAGGRHWSFCSAIRVRCSSRRS